MLLQQTVEPVGTVYDTDGFDTVLNQPVKDEVAADRQAVQLGAISARSHNPRYVPCGHPAAAFVCDAAGDS
jgi:hypothetical protein